jgi:hypothetical protein
MLCALGMRHCWIKVVGLFCRYVANGELTMKPFLYLSFLVLAACGVKHTSVDYGKTTVSDLVAEKGVPLKEEKTSAKDGKMLIYPDNEKYQVDGDVVTHGLKDPKGDEKTVIYWKHKFKDCATTTQQISKPQGHETPEYELKCPEQGLTVIFRSGSDFVSRIIENEKK